MIKHDTNVVGVVERIFVENETDLLNIFPKSAKHFRESPGQILAGDLHFVRLLAALPVASLIVLVTFPHHALNKPVGEIERSRILGQLADHQPGQAQKVYLKHIIFKMTEATINRNGCTRSWSRHAMVLCK